MSREFFSGGGGLEVRRGKKEEGDGSVSTAILQNFLGAFPLRL